MTRCSVYALNPHVDLWHFTSDGRLNHVNNSLTRDYCFEYQYNEDLTERSDIVLRCPQKYFKLLQKSLKIQYIFQKFLCTADGLNRTDFWIQNFFWLGPFLTFFLI